MIAEFEVHYWKHQQHVKEVRKKEAQKLVKLFVYIEGS